MCNRNKIDFSWGPCKAGKILNETGSMHRAKNTVIEFKALISKKMRAGQLSQSVTYTVFRCHIDAAKQRRALNFELVVNN